MCIEHPSSGAVFYSSLQLRLSMGGEQYTHKAACSHGEKLTRGVRSALF